MTNITELWSTLLQIFYSECDYKITQTNAAALITAHDDAIRLEVLQKVRAEIMDDHSEMTYDDYEEGYKDGLENALAIIDAAMLVTKPARDMTKHTELALGNKCLKCANWDDQNKTCAESNVYSSLGSSFVPCHAYSHFEPAREES